MSTHAIKWAYFRCSRPHRKKKASELALELTTLELIANFNTPPPFFVFLFFPFSFLKGTHDLELKKRHAEKHKCKSGICYLFPQELFTDLQRAPRLHPSKISSKSKPSFFSIPSRKFFFLFSSFFVLRSIFCFLLVSNHAGPMSSKLDGKVRYLCKVDLFWKNFPPFYTAHGRGAGVTFGHVFSVNWDSTWQLYFFFLLQAGRCPE